MRVFPKKMVGLHVATSLTLVGGGFALAAMKGASSLIYAAIAFGGVVFFLFSMRKYFRRAALTRKPMREEWQELLAARIPFYAKLEGEAKKRFENDVRFFASEQNIYGPRGEPVSDEDRLLVAASAAILGHGLPGWEWPTMRDIVVYKKAFNDQYEEGDDESIAGMVHSQGPIIFSENHLKHGFQRSHDGFNVGLHELAHVMDMADGAADGVPAGMDWMATAPWVEVMARHMKKKSRRGKREVLDDYSKTNEAEFFAVAVETFFEKPKIMKRKEPKLYELLCDYFGQDPLSEGGEARRRTHSKKK